MNSEEMCMHESGCVNQWTVFVARPDHSTDEVYCAEHAPLMPWAIGDTVRLYTAPHPSHGSIGTIVELHTRKCNGSIRYTVLANGGEIYASEGNLRRPS